MTLPQSDTVQLPCSRHHFNRAPLDWTDRGTQTQGTWAIALPMDAATIDVTRVENDTSFSFSTKPFGICCCLVLPEKKEEKLPEPKTGWTSRCTPVVGRSLDHQTEDMVKVSDRVWLVTSSSSVPIKTQHVGKRCTLNLSTAQTFYRWCGVVLRKGCRPRHDHDSKFRGMSPKALM
ncbi:uncharacterized protein TNCV_2451911 [Trichonephila clavipes]|nr:uncharacterized protein TNCV_2451911 [Trichonephila clavipes]